MDTFQKNTLYTFLTILQHELHRKHGILFENSLLFCK
jgi:hypothetical protein